MKRLFSVFLALSLLLTCLAGCGKEPEPTQTVPSTEPGVTTEPTKPPIPFKPTLPTETTVPPETTEPLAPALQELMASLPVMDGSTSLIPLEAGLRAAYLDVDPEQAEAMVSHSSSWQSFYNLLEGNAELVFSVPLSAEQQRLAADAGVALETVPIAMEGFVFVVNAENPVDTLTQQQLRDIYSGKITNWSEVGGLDEEIIAYQRNMDSGSQNYMIAFMGDTPLTDAPTELRPASMFGLMEVIAVNDNSRAAIGYSVYAYAADMYGNGNEIKFIKVDGVAPSKQSFADGTYPLMGYNYAVFRADEPEEGRVRPFVDWILSDEGQQAIAEAGYVTVRDIGYQYTEAVLHRYDAAGTGPSAPAEVPSHEYVVLSRIHEVYDWGPYERITNTLDLDHAVSPDGIPFWQITQLADKALEAEINGWIDASIAALLPEIPAMVETTERLNRSYEYNYCQIPNYADGSKPFYFEATLKNGYLSLSISLCYRKNGNDDHYKYYRTEAAVWDLVTGKRLPNEALFCRGVDIDAVLNAYLTEYTQMVRGEFRHKPEMIRDFIALPESGWHLTPDAIYIDGGGDTFLNGERIPLDWLPDGVLAADIPRDFSDALVLDEDLSVIRRIRVSDRDLSYAYYAHHDDYEFYDVKILKEDAHPNAAAINEDLLTYLRTYYQVETIYEYFEGLGYSTDDLNILWLNWYSSVLGGRYLLAEGSNPYVYVQETDRFIYYPYEATLLYDLETGQRLDWTDILRDGWLEHATMQRSYPEEPVDPAGYVELHTEWFRYYSDTNQLCINLSDGENSYYDLYIPGEYIIF